MNILKIFVAILAIFAISVKASAIVRRNASDSEDDDDIQNIDDGNDEKKDLITQSIKSRVIAIDPKLCQELSRYHPHYPKCQLYCENLKHWMGMCRRDTCYCYS